MDIKVNIANHALIACLVDEIIKSLEAGWCTSIINKIISVIVPID